MSRDFNGTTSKIDFGSPALYDNMEPLTVAAWIQADNEGETGAGRIVAKASVAAASGTWRLAMEPAGAFSFTKDYATTDLFVASSTGYIKTDGTTWVHLAASWTGGASTSNVVLYVNGETAAYNVAVNVDGTGTKNTDALTPLVIGNVGAQTRTFDGRIAHVHLFSRILTKEEVQSLMLHPAIQSTGAVGAASGALVGYWSLYGEGAVEPDHSGNGQVGTLTTTPADTRNPPSNEEYVASVPVGYAA